ncbi:MAG: SDR family NAD(P)-dependent oxidoreductase [Rhodospirillaceae bacterium]|nr:SDR family NAD(P)-dependent oxidoreductase [Rhodospirillaceae bacterium]
MDELSGRTAVITGAASGIGAGMAEAFAEAGVNLALLDLDEERLRRAADRLSGGVVEVRCFAADVSDRDAMKRAAAQVADAFPAVHILCNNAGVGYTGVPLDRVPDADWDWVIGVNLMGVVNGLQAFLPAMLAHGEGGHIVNSASIGGHHVMPGWRYGVYTTSKFAVVGLSEALANDLADRNIGVSLLCPAAVDTAIYDVGRNRPARFGGPYEQAPDPELAAALKAGMTPVEVGRWTIRAILDGQLYIFPHPHTRDFIARRHGRLMAAYDWAAQVAPDIGAATSGGRP